MTLLRSVAVLCAVTLTLACASTPETAPSATPTYWQDVAPLFAKYCGQCHSEQGIGPIRLDEPAEAKEFAALIAHATRSRAMPPWAVTSDGSCGEFRHSLALTEAEIALIGAWADAGAPEGEARALPKPKLPSLGDASELLTPSFAPQIQGGDYAAYDEYRCFPLELGVDGQEFITGYEVVPGRAEIVHHLIGELVDTNALAMDGSGRSNAEVMRALDDASPEREGWPCFTGAGDGVLIEATPVVWAPGQGVVEYPEDSGVLLRPGRVLIAQVHYNLVDPKTRGLSVQTTIRLQRTAHVGNLGMFVVIDPLLESLASASPITLPPLDAAAQFAWERSGADMYIDESATLQLRGVMPHMHGLGRKYRLTHHADGEESETCAADVQHWDFHWQRMYFFEDALPVRRGSKLSVTCEYDTTSVTQPVRPGWSTQNEMCTTTFYFTVPFDEHTLSSR
jgi:mono/diheme cytochrome c family protein